VSKACAIVELSRRAWYREDPAERQLAADQPIIDALNAVVKKHARWGFWKCFYRLRNLGHPWNHKRVWRVYTQMRLNQKRRTKKRLPERTPSPLDIPAQLNHTWSFDFMSDSLYSGQRYRVLNILDEGVREALDIVVDTSITAQRVVRTLEQIKAERGLPSVIRVDNELPPYFDCCRQYKTQTTCSQNRMFNPWDLKSANHSIQGSNLAQMSFTQHVF
jgi:putative transposase